jgi:glycine/D-amino acid oxidase-like deaminating enzyme/nitrite reductase/ring-hydroxylating ferredoxin subunit
MNTARERTRSLWMAETALETPPALDRDIETDIAVVGAGIAGLTVAYRLATLGRDVVVLDAGPLGGGMTARTTAHLAYAIDDRFEELLRLRGTPQTRLAAEAHLAAIDFIAETQAKEAIDCDFARVDGFLFLGEASPPDVLERELVAAGHAGVDVDRVERSPLGIPALRFPRHGRFEPLRYLAGLARCVRRDGGRLFAGTRVVSVEDGKEVVVTTESNHRVRARAAVVATNTPVNDRLVTHTKQAPYRSYAIAARLTGAVVDALYWDTDDPYHYVRLHRDWLIVGGEDHKTGQADDYDARFAKLEAWARTRFPIGAVGHRWSGQVMEPVDGLGFIGRNPGDANVYIATGDSGMGMTHGTIAGLLIPDLIQKKSNPWEKVFAVDRVTPKATGEFLKENLNVAAQFKDFVLPGEISSADELKPGEGAVIRRGLKKIAAYRDETGTLHENSAICTHMGCPVRWNVLERAWDCPCHGSQFAPEGEVLNGPAVSRLPKAD